MKQEELALTSDQRAALGRLDVLLLYIHGSVVAGTARSDSDVDIAVLFEKGPKDSIQATGDVIQALSSFARGREIDIAILNEASPLLKQVVASTGKLLYARSPEDTLRFELRSMHEYEYSRHIVGLGQELILRRAGV